MGEGFRYDGVTGSPSEARDGSVTCVNLKMFKKTTQTWLNILKILDICIV
jgi:hypothetical protein